MFKKIKDTFVETRDKMDRWSYDQMLPLIKEFCEYLCEIGVNASILEFESPEALRGLAYVRIEGRNIDLAQYELHTPQKGGPSKWYDSHYYLHVNVEGLENKLKAEAKPVKKGLFSSEIVDCRWEGGELAQRLNADSDLKSMLIKEGLGRIKIGTNKELAILRNLQFVWIDGEKISNKKMFPSLSAFKTYDRIAKHIRNIAGNLAREGLQ